MDILDTGFIVLFPAISVVLCSLFDPIMYLDLVFERKSIRWIKRVVRHARTRGLAGDHQVQETRIRLKGIYTDLGPQLVLVTGKKYKLL
jgi:hypothetical protein